MWNSLLVSIYTTPEYRPQEFAGEEFYFATIEEFEIAIDISEMSAISRISAFFRLLSFR